MEERSSRGKWTQRRMLLQSLDVTSLYDFCLHLELKLPPSQIAKGEV